MLREETGEKVNPGDVVTRVKGLRDISVQKRFQKKKVIDLCADFPLFQQAVDLSLKKSRRLFSNTAAVSPYADNDEAEDEDDVLTTEATAIRTRQQSGASWNCMS